VNEDVAPLETGSPVVVDAVPVGDAAPEAEPVPLVYGAPVYDGEPDEPPAPGVCATFLGVGVAMVDGFVTNEAGALVTELDGGVMWSSMEP